MILLPILYPLSEAFMTGGCSSMKEATVVYRALLRFVFWVTVSILALSCASASTWSTFLGFAEYGFDVPELTDGDLVSGSAVEFSVKTHFRLNNTRQTQIRDIEIKDIRFELG